MSAFERQSGMPVDLYEDDPDALAIVNSDGGVLLLAGHEAVLPGVAQAWALYNRNLTYGLGKSLVREVRELVERVMSSNNYRQIRILASDPQDYRFNRLVGFEMEGIWKRAGPDMSDIYVMCYERRH